MELSSCLILGLGLFSGLEDSVFVEEFVSTLVRFPIKTMREGAAGDERNPE